MKICVPIREQSQKTALCKAKLARKKGADMVEIWLDCIRDLDKKWLFKHLPHPYIVKKENLKGMDDLDADYVDIDLKLAQKSKNRTKKVFKLIISYHNFEKTPELDILLKIVKQAFSLGADIVKIATKINKFSENVILFELVRRMKVDGKKIIVIGMGDRGKISRFGCLILGGYLTYAALDEKSKTAEGQMMLSEILSFKL